MVMKGWAFLGSFLVGIFGESFWGSFWGRILRIFGILFAVLKLVCNFVDIIVFNGRYNLFSMNPEILKGIVGENLGGDDGGETSMGRKRKPQRG